jgi:catalase
MQRLGDAVGKMQRRVRGKLGPGRAFHRKQLIAAEGTFEVLKDLPEHACQGLFAAPGTYRARVRLSSGDPTIQPDWMGDLRGFAIKVHDVGGDREWGSDPGPQDILLSNHDHQPVRDSREFLGFLEAAEAVGGGLLGKGAALFHLAKAHGLPRAFDAARSMLKKFRGFAAERFTSGVPIRCGPYAVKVRLKPVGNPPARGFLKGLGMDMRERLAAGPVQWDVELQFFVDEETTPIENANKVWPDAETPIVTVGRLTLTTELAAGAAEQDRFDPWIGLKVHRPLGDLMQARKVTYIVSRAARGVPFPP